MKNFILKLIFLFLGLNNTNINAFLRSNRNIQRRVERRQITNETIGNYPYYTKARDNSYVKYLSYWISQFQDKKLKIAVQNDFERFSKILTDSPEINIKILSTLIEMGLIIKDTCEKQIDFEVGKNLFINKYDYFINNEEFILPRHLNFVCELYKNQFENINPQNMDVLGLNGNILSQVFTYYLQGELQNDPERFDDIIKALKNYYICPICYDENAAKNKDNIIICPHGHIICKECLAGSIRAGISEQNPDKFTCSGILGTECNYEYTDDQLHSAGISDDNLKGLFIVRGEDLKRHLIQDIGIEAEKDLFSCPKCNFTALIKGVKEWKAYKCPQCEYKCCPNCLKEPHFGKSCEEAKLEEIDDIFLFFTNAISESILVPCAGCGTPIQKDEQCNKLHCTVCGTYTCHACGKNIGNAHNPNSKPYDHFKPENSNCPMFYKDPSTGLAFKETAEINEQSIFLLEEAIEKSKENVRIWVNTRLDKNLPIKLHGEILDINRIDLDELLNDFAEEIRQEN